MSVDKFAGFEPKQGVYYITGEYPNENYDTGIIKCLFEPKPNAPCWAALSVFPMAQLNKPISEIYRTSDEVKAAIAAKRETRRNEYRNAIGDSIFDLTRFMLNHDCATGSDPIAREVAIEAMNRLGIRIDRPM